ncbi:EH signature domain-containing protein [Candidatus Marimicrobium litorale]|nr:EH signature domain-containing protein [Candidatus Marimicrobium litorale]
MMKWTNASVTDFTSIVLPTISVCEDRARAMQSSDAALDNVRLDPDKIVSAIMSDSARLTSKELRALPYCIFESEFQHHNLSFARKILERLGEKPNFWRRLFRAWIFHYCPETDLGDFVSEQLKKHRQHLVPSQSQLIDLLGVCDGALSKKDLFEHLIEKNEAAVAYEIGLRDGIGTTKLAVAALNTLAYYVAERDNSDDQMERFIKLVSEGGKKVSKSLEVAVMIGVIRGGDKLALDSEMSKECREIIENNFPDPSIYKSKWPAVPNSFGGEKTRDACMQIARRWRVFQSINLFFQVIDETITEPGVQHQFPRRKAFWLDYFNRNVVSEAWILLGKKASEHMANLKKQGDAEIMNLTYGKLKGANRDQSVLLLKVGALTVMERSHDGACRVWKSTNSYAPKLHKVSYRNEELMSECEDRIIHDKTGRWTAKLHTIIRNKGGVRRRV